jgi:predicted ATPase/transcriptional regulator with XRE-family HTH domain
LSVPRGAATFGSLLREHRLAAGLTQEALAERSGVSPRTIQQLEADSVRPRRSTARYLAQALALSGTARDELENAATPMPRRRLSALPDSSDTGPARRDGGTIVAVPLSQPDDAIREHALVALPRPAPTNVPWPVSSLLGREADLAAIRDLIAVEGQRLVTLTGMGGSGKTRLAVQVAAELLDAFVDGVWFVELAPTSSPTLVPRVVAGALGVREVEHAPILDTLIGHLRRKRLLLVLDNCEHLVDACAELAERLLTACPDLHILATSREPLRVGGEQQRRVQPLAVPDPDDLASFDALAGAPSVRLFVERAQAIDADFRLTEANAASVAQVCARLDGIPLAIELAASRIGVLAVEQLAERLDDSFRVLVGGTRAGSIRQQTMEAALAWSYDLLTAAEQVAFRSLSTCAGGFDLDAADAICSGEDAEAADLLDVLGRLVDKSLVVADQAAHGRRYRLLEPVRQYGQRSLLASNEDERARTRHAAYYAALAERVALLLRGPEQIAWLDRLEVERDNLRAALGWIAEREEPEAGLRLAVAMTPYWEAHGYLTEGRRWLKTVLTASRAGGATSAMQMRARIAAGGLAQWQGDFDDAETLLVGALATARDLSDSRSEAMALAWLSAVYRRQGAVERALMLGEESLRLGSKLADETVIAFALLSHGVTLHHHDERDRAVSVLDESLGRFRQLGDARYIAITTTMLGRIILVAGEHERAAVMLREAVLALKAVGDQGFLVEALAGCARVAQVQGELGRAVMWLAASVALREALGMSCPAPTHKQDLSFRASLQAQLTAAEFDENYALGEAMSLDQVLAEIVAAPGQR